MKLALRQNCASNSKPVGENIEHTTSVWNILSDYSKRAVQKARKAAK